MKRALLAFALVITVAVAAIALYVASTNDDSSDPATTVRKALDAYESDDPATVQGYFCDPALADVILPGADTPRFVFESMSIREDSRDGDSAIVILNANVSTSANSDPVALTWRLELERSDATWCISDVNTP